ncbi:hypothetical protein QUB10_33415 [Microcoleus sp. B5-D4]|uniref:hypothetical protein n=1 Tax=Microcoleus sp. B5-D4 TaxID=2818681 RepID=UPI002FD5B9A1
MTNIHEYYDSMADISVSIRGAVENLELAKKNVQEALIAINALRKQGDTTISFVSNVTTNDVHRNLLFLELLLNQNSGLVQYFVFQELLSLTTYESSQEEFQLW